MEHARDDARVVVPGWPDGSIATVAARQRALITSRQLLGLGVSSSAIGRAVARRRLHPIHRGVYALVTRPALPALALEQAALLACGPRALISHASAAALWGLCPPLTESVAVTVVAGEAGRSRPGITVHRVHTLDRRDARRRSALPVTSPARTLLDRAPVLSDRQLERELDEALVRRLTSRTAIGELLDRCRRRSGTPRLRELIDPERTTTFTRAESEERMLALLRRGGLPMPETNVRMQSIEVDFLWRDERVIVEVDGWTSHGTRAAFERDRGRDARLENDGWRVLRFTWRRLTGEPEAVLVEIATALALRR
jgi:very-short-patch-repair endonuclease